jgi:IS30 family transposase
MRQARDLFKASLLLQNHSWRARANAINWSPGTIKRERRRNTAKCPASWASVRTPVKIRRQRGCQQSRRAGRLFERLRTFRPLFDEMQSLQRLNPFTKTAMKAFASTLVRAIAS